MNVRIDTRAGRVLDVLHPDPEQIHIEDIAQSLSRQCRYLGYTKHFYSVAQHSVLVSLAVPEHLALAGLLHDASEAYLHDIVSPLKHSPIFEGYRMVENMLMGVIAQKFNAEVDHPEVHAADKRIAIAEARSLLVKLPSWAKCDLVTETIKPWSDTVSKETFLKRFKEVA